MGEGAPSLGSLAQALGDAETFSDETFSHLESAGETVRGRRFEDCRFVECRFEGPAFRGCAFVRCVFEGCDLSNLPLDGLRFVEVLFRDSKLIGVDWTRLNPDPLTSFYFEGCLLDYSDFPRLKLKGIRLSRCSLRGANFERADLTGADLREAELSDAIFTQSDLSRADLRGARGYAIDVTTSRVKGVKFSLPEALTLLAVQGIIIE